MMPGPGPTRTASQPSSPAASRAPTTRERLVLAAVGQGGGDVTGRAGSRSRNSGDIAARASPGSPPPRSARSRPVAPAKPGEIAQAAGARCPCSGRTRAGGQKNEGSNPVASAGKDSTGCWRDV